MSNNADLRNEGGEWVSDTEWMCDVCSSMNPLHQTSCRRCVSVRPSKEMLAKRPAIREQIRKSIEAGSFDDTGDVEDE